MSKLYAAAIRLLARREHSAEELRRKLGSRDWDEEEGVTSDSIEDLLVDLQQQGLQSDQRYAESYTHMRFNKGYGPVRIDNELRERGVSESIRRECIAQLAQQWWPLMQQTRERKFGSDIPGDYKERAKQMRYLQYRGFASDQIRDLLS